MAGNDEWRRYKNNDERGRTSGSERRASERRADQPRYDRDRGGRTASVRSSAASVYDFDF